MKGGDLCLVHDDDEHTDSNELSDIWYHNGNTKDGYIPKNSNN